MIRISFFLMFLLISCSAQKNEQQEEKVVIEKQLVKGKLVWSDEFDKDGLPDIQKWSYDIGDACNLPMGCGWGNNELQYYTEKKLKNARVENGHLIIEAHRENIGKSQYSSARLLSKGKADFLYGQYEIRAKIPGGLGAWAAIWMMPTNDKYGGWPRSGEIDIMEHVGFDKDTIFGTPHTMAFNGMIGTQKSGGIEILDCEEEFHTYKVNWTEDKIEWFVDDLHYHTFYKVGEDSDKWPFDHPFHFILNLAVGGNWGGKHGVDEKIWPKRMEVDFVRVYQFE